MALTDILGGAITLAGATVFIYGLNKLMKDHYLPWADEVQREYDKEEKRMKDDYEFSKYSEGEK
jgi:hypothetical protein